MFPKRFERSTVQNDRTICCALGEIGGSCGKRTGFSMILKYVGMRSGVQGRRKDLLFINFDRVLVPEWRISCKEFVYQNAQGPPVDRRGMTFILNHLGREILRSAAESICFDWPIIFTAQSLSETEIHKLHMTVAV